MSYLICFNFAAVSGSTKCISNIFALPKSLISTLFQSEFTSIGNCFRRDLLLYMGLAERLECLTTMQETERPVMIMIIINRIVTTTLRKKGLV